ncbi:hypothetical protein CEUSTIGMA_g9091.t1 [Chlamydomonas eustigma]|uniref:Ubiquitin-like domain-containing protein n=1 Tax=Chlamydomonas eustigma TaxID=1157962 RepID=A0A250XF33_9CHLO|nr:hypothetical protein CEUSTIGMA_g9091.t1 [Chlamydomonas eustigma]|eukprot:GAX81663.1 hypothetical protein CEUSTIGMA_g9091.t1 [Chlamydomonas eustigma]
MELGNLESTRGAYQNTKQMEADEEQGDEVTLVLKLPDGAYEHRFKIGVTVAYVKLVIEKEHGLAMDKTLLKLNGKLLLDPFSLCDCQGVAAGLKIDVEVIRC